MDTSRAKQELGWSPRFTALEALRGSLRPKWFAHNMSAIHPPLLVLVAYLHVRNQRCQRNHCCLLWAHRMGNNGPAVEVSRV